MQFDILESLFRTATALQHGISLEDIWSYFIETPEEPDPVRVFHHKSRNLFRTLDQPLRYHQVFLEKVEAEDYWITLHPFIFVGEATGRLDQSMKLGCAAVLLQKRLRTEPPDQKDCNLLSLLLHWFPPEEPASPNFPRWSTHPLWKSANEQPGVFEERYLEEWIQSRAEHLPTPPPEKFKELLAKSFKSSGLDEMTYKNTLALLSQFRTLCLDKKELTLL
ncbi:MAG: hypothetical protein AB7O96_18750 [Pseudobdellovibrionaceae bacterium]